MAPRNVARSEPGTFYTSPPTARAGLAALATTKTWLTTVDHKRIGILYGVTAFAFILIGGIEALIIRLQLVRPHNTLVDAPTYNALFTMHGTTMIFLAIMPLSAAFFNYMIPLLIGARDVAFPRLNALLYWIFLLGGLFINASFLVGAPPDGGWFGYTSLTLRQYSPGMNIDFWLLGLQVLGASSVMAGVNFIVTILNMRAPGLTLMRMPVFVWMTLTTQFLIVLAFPPVTIGLVFVMFDRFFGTHFYDVAAGGDLHLWQHLFWIFGHPEVYILILPAFGIVSEVLPTFSRKPLFGGQVMIYSGVLIGFFGFGVWSHHMFAAGMGPVADAFFAISTMLIAIPTGVKIFNWLATMWGGTIRATVPFHYAAGLVALFTIGGLSGVMHASPPVDLQQTDTYFVVAHFHYVLIGGSLFGILAGASYWWPKMTGRLLDERLGRLGFWVLFAGFNLTFFPQHYLGAIGMPRRIYTYAAGTGWGFWNFWSTVGAVGALTSLALVLIGAAVLVGGSFAFALEHHRNPAHVRQEGGLGVDHRKLAMWVFLGSECFLFGTLIATYMAYKGRSVVGPHPHEILNLPITTLSTFDLLMSSLLMVLALAAVRRGDRFQSRLWLAGTAFFGLIFLGFQAYEFTSFVHEGLTLQTNLFGSDRKSVV